MGTVAGRLGVTVTGPGSWTLERREPEAAVPPHAARLRLVSAGVCGGDLALLRGANAVASYPLTLGHECVAEVVQTGVRCTLAVGDHVVVFPTLACGHCSACRAQQVNQCPSMRVRGLSHPGGLFADELVLPEAQLIRVPGDVAHRYGALVEPVAVACHVASRAGQLAGAHVLVIGCGVIGSLSGLACRLAGAASVHGVDRHETRRATAAAVGLSGFSRASGDELVDWVRREVGPVDVVLDTVCVESTVHAAVEVLRPGGRLVTVASAEPEQRLPLPYARFFLKELSAVAARNYVRADFVAAVDLLSRHQPDLDPLITGRFTLDRFGAALQALADAPERHLKVLLAPSAGAGRAGSQQAAEESPCQP